MIFRIIVLLLIVAADQTFKYWAVTNLAGSSFRPEIPGLIGLTYVENKGAAFGMMQNMRWLFLAITAIVVVAILFSLFKERVYGRLGSWSLIMISGGAIGNFIDRAFSGYVVDMFEFKFMYFAIFNMADVFITVGATLFCFYLLFVHDRLAGKKAEGKHKDAPQD